MSFKCNSTVLHFDIEWNLIQIKLKNKCFVFNPKIFFFKLKLVEINTYTCVLHVWHYKCILMSNNVFKLHIKMSWSVCVRQSLASRFQISPRYGVVIYILRLSVLSKSLTKKNMKRRKIKTENLVNHSLW